MDIFSKIAAGEIPSYKCAEDEQFYAFLRNKVCINRPATESPMPASKAVMACGNR